MLKAAMSRKPMPPWLFDTAILSHASQCMDFLSKHPFHQNFTMIEINLLHVPLDKLKQLML
jgi:hypothetical protein